MNKPPERITLYPLLQWINQGKIFWFLLFFLQGGLMAQEIVIEVHEIPLNQLLIQVAREHGVQLSFDDQNLSKYSISVHNSFSSAEEAIAFLLKDLPLEYQKNGEVYVIFKKKKKVEIKAFRLSGRVVDFQSMEPLPYSHLLINNTGQISDFNGNFARTQTRDSVFNVSVSYLGYYILDTILNAGKHMIGLTPSIIGLKEVVIEGSSIERSGQTGEEAGVIRLNHKVAYRLPGNGDNAVFNFLRLQPGILAAGEQSSEMIIWGSYSGHSQVLFDGFTIFGLKNFNDNISFVNPYMVKDIRVLKGGFSAEYGDRVGGIVEISGINGNTQKPSINLNINNMTVNGMASIPLKKKSSLTFAYRHTYYNLYDADDLSVKARGRRNPNQADIHVSPDYLFRDFNLKYAGSTASDDSYHVSLYQGRDQFSYEVDQEQNGTQVNQDAEEENRQLGGALFYGKSWKSGIYSNLSLSVSGLNRDLFESQEITRSMNDTIISSRDIFYSNRILETNLKNQNYIPLSEKHRLEAGWNYIYNSIAFREDSFETTIHDSQIDAHRISMHVQDEMSISRNFRLTPGIRLDYPLHLGKVYIQPRIKASIDLTDQWRLNGAWGIYNQFISETSVIDDLGNYRYFWAICDNSDVPVLQAQHLVGGITYKYDGLTIGLETFYKTTEGITRYVNLWRRGLQTVFQGEARVYGMDLLIKKYFKKHEAWASYTLSKTEEYFPYFPFYEYSYAPQDQRHEVKGAMLLNFKSLFFSVNYVYGSGFLDRPAFFNNTVERYPYSRLDAALLYRYSIRDYHFEAGISILNVLNTENIKYSNFIRIPDRQSTSISIHAEAVPFTPTIYLNLSF